MERTLSILPKCNVFRIPPRSAAKGYFCQNWDPNGVLLKDGRIKVIATGDDLRIQIESPDTGEIFGVAPYKGESTVERCVDSSRYYVIRIEDKGRHAFVGLGFDRREESFDFITSITDHVKQVKRSQDTTPMVTKEQEKDYSLPQGGNIKIKLNLKRPANQRDSPSQPTADGGGGLNLPPPPQAAPAKASNDDWGDFGDFVGTTQASETKGDGSWTTF